MSKANIPDDGKRYLLVTPDTMACVLKSPEFIKASDLGDAVVQEGVVGKIAGFKVIEWNDSTANLAMLAGHPRFATRAEEFSVPVLNLYHAGRVIPDSMTPDAEHNWYLGDSVHLGDNGVIQVERIMGKWIAYRL